MMEFESIADKLFTHLYKKFDTDTMSLDRDRDENVFQQSAARYAYTLKEQLSQNALELIEKNRYLIADISHVQQMLTRRIAVYVNEFKQKLKK